MPCSLGSGFTPEVFFSVAAAEVVISIDALFWSVWLLLRLLENLKAEEEDVQKVLRLFIRHDGLFMSLEEQTS